jgi:hypothetical protein
MKPAASRPGSGTSPKLADARAEATKTAKSVSGIHAPKQPSLRAVLTEILKKKGRSMTGGELAAAVLKTGYLTTSERPADVVWAMLQKMDHVEHIPGKGYRLKKTTA